MKQIETIDINEMIPIIEPVLNNGGAVRLTVIGNSMYPLLRSGRDSVVIKKTKKLKKGDIPFYKRSDGSYVLHRIVKIDDDGYTMCGDNQTDIEFPIYPEQIIGKVVKYYRGDRPRSCRSGFYRLYTFFWVNFFNARPFMSRIIDFFRGLKNKLRGDKKV